MEKETKTAEETPHEIHEKWNQIWRTGQRNDLNGEQHVWEAMKEYANLRITQQQEINADLKKQNAELVKELNKAIKYLKFVDSLSDKLEFDSVSHEGEKTKLKNTLGFSGARELIQNTSIKIES